MRKLGIEWRREILTEWVLAYYLLAPALKKKDPKVKATRPIYLNLWRIRLPLPGVISILHRISGVVIFLGLPLLLYLLHQSLLSQESFDHLVNQMTNPGLRIALWVIASAFAWHFIAGIRHLLMDMGVGESLRGGRATAYVVFIIAVILIILLGIWIW